MCILLNIKCIELSLANVQEIGKGKEYEEKN